MSSSTNFSFSSPMSILILLVAFASLLVLPTSISKTRSPSHIGFVNSGFTATLKHVDSDKNLTRTELLKRAIGQGRRRMEMLHTNMMRSSHDLIITAPIHQESGGFIMNLSIGTPPVPYTAVVDTGSDLIWTQCKPCRPCFNQTSPIFDPKNSTTFSKLNCSADLCNALFSPYPHSCNNKSDDCEYVQSYADHASIEGYFATETLTFEGNVSVPKVGFGCAVNNTEDFEGEGDGIVGLGRGDVSLVSQLHEAKFSYCLPSIDSNKTGILSMGSRVNSWHPHMVTTHLIKNPSRYFATRYYFHLQGITINHTRLQINESSFAMQPNGSRGMWIDSGSTLTYLEKSAFYQVKKELTLQINLPRVNGSDFDELDLCFNITSHQSFKFPHFIFHFNDYAKLMLPAKNMFSTYTGHIKCLMMLPTDLPDGTSIFDYYQQQNTLVVYDLVKETLSFLSNVNCGKLL